MLSIKKAALTRMVTNMKMKEVMSQLGCLVGDQQYVDTARPDVYDCYEAKNECDPSSQFPLVWRDQVAANIQLAATPEGRSLTSL